MSKIDLDPITSGYNLSKINANFQKVEDELNNKVLYRDSPAGEPNSMSSNLDMNSRSILNANKISSNVLELGGVQVVPTSMAVDPYNGTREALRRSYAEAGYHLVDGSFEVGGVLVNANDVLLQESTGKAFSGPVGNVAAGTSPASGGFIDVSGALNQGGFASYTYVRNYSGVNTSIEVKGRSAAGDGGEGIFDIDAHDTSTPDDDCTVLVGVSGVRWKRRGVSNSVNVAWAGAKPNDPSFDSTLSFKNAMKAVYRLSKTLTATWPTTIRCALVGPNGDYYFSSGFITPDFSAPNFVNYDILMAGATFRPLPAYDLRYPLIHAKACFEYDWEFGVFGFQSTTGANDTMYVVFNDSSREQNYGGKCSYKIKAGDTEYVIRHELESVVASFDGCMSNKNIKRFLRVWRCDQAKMSNCFFNWEQAGKATYDSFIQWGLDDGVTSEPNYPGNGNYNVGRLTVTNSMFIPNGTGVPRVHTGWFENIGGVIRIGDGCHFGPESNNRPSVVLNRAIGATFSSQTDLTESGIYIDGASCASSWDVVYCISDYPNVISIKNIRWNVLDYSGGAKLTYLIGGNAAILNSKSSKYSRANRSFFHFNCSPGAPAWKGINDVDPSLEFASGVTTRDEVVLGLAPWVNLPTTTLSYDIQNRDGLMPAVPNAGGYRITNTYSINSTAESKLITATSEHFLSIVKNGLNMELHVTSIASPPTSVIGTTPSLTAVFVGPTGSEVATAPKANIDAGIAYFVRLKYTSNLSANTFVGEDVRIRRIT